MHSQPQLATRRTTKKSESASAENGNVTHAYSDPIMGSGVIGLSCTLRFAVFFCVRFKKKK